MALNTVTLTWDLTDLIQAGQSVEVALVPSSVLTDSTDDLVITPVVKSVLSSGGTGSLAGIIATDNVQLLPAGWWYTVTVTQYGGIGSVLVPPSNIYLNFALGATQDLSDVLQVPVVAQMSQYLPLPAGTPVAGYVPQATGIGEATQWATAAAASLPLTTLGDTLYENATPSPARLAGNTSATKKFLTQTGTGTVSAPPAWSGIAAADMPTGTTGAQGALQLDGTTADITAAPGTAAAGSTGKAADAGHTHPSPTVFGPTGLTGATSASRYAGATASGHPGSGTFATGDFVIDRTGQMWICTAGGSPGTWATGAVIDGTTGDIAAAPGTAAAGSVGKAADAGHVHPQPSMFAPTGLTGATSSSRYVGATASGAPGSGTFSTGDYVIDQTGTIWICTTGGSPGSWSQVSGSGAQGVWQPAVNNLLAATSDLDPCLMNLALGAGGPLSTGRLLIAKLQTSKSVTFSNVWSWDVAAATSPTYIAVAAFNTSGTQLAVSSDFHATGLSALRTGVALGASVTATPASPVYIGILCVASGGAGTILGLGQPGSGSTQMGLTAATARWATTSASGLSTMPGSFTPASNVTLTASTLWFGVS